MKYICAVEYMRIMVVALAEPVFYSPLFAAIVNCFVKTRFHVLEIVGMQFLEPVFSFRMFISVIISEYLKERFPPPYRIVNQVPIPQRIVSGAGNQPEPFFARSERPGSFHHFCFKSLVNLFKRIFSCH